MRIAARVEDRAVERETNRVLRAMNLVRVDDGIIAAAAAHDHGLVVWAPH